MESLYCAAPVCFPHGLSVYTGFAEPFVLVWLVPITVAETEYVRNYGWREFETLLELEDPDLSDLGRPAVVTER
jgi:hypothetical protein